MAWICTRDFDNSRRYQRNSRVDHWYYLVDRSLEIYLTLKHIHMKKFKLGKEAKDKISGLTGIITGIASYLTGCDQYVIQPPSKDGEFKEGRWFDEGRIEIVGKGIKQEEVLSEENGCDYTAPIK